MGAFSRSVELAKQSFRVLRQDPELMVFLVFSILATTVAMLTFAGVGFLAGGFTPEGGVTSSGLVLLFLFYFVTYGITIYFQVALVACVQHRLSGGDPNVSYGIGEANKRLGAILSWAVITAIVGMILKLLESAIRDRAGGVGHIVASIALSLVGMAWGLATFFVIPVIAADGVGGFEAVRRSAGIIKRRWGEAVIGNAGVGLVAFAAVLVGVVVLGGLAFMAIGIGGPVGTTLGVLFVVIGVTYVVIVSLVSSTLQSIYTAILHRYATVGDSSQYFSNDLIAGAFKPHQRSGWM